MRYAFLFWILLGTPLTGAAQIEIQASRPDCDSLFRAGDSHLRRQNLQQALQCYLGAMNCDTRLAGKVGPKIEEVFGRIERQQRSEAAAKEEAERKRVEADSQRLKAEWNEILAEKRKKESDSIASVAQRAALAAYADGLAYKSQIALREGDRNTAFRLAEFAHRYLYADNPKVIGAMMEALYYDELLPPRPPLPREYILEGHANGINSIAYSSDRKLLASGSKDNTVKVWNAATHKVLFTLSGHKKNVSSVAFSPDSKWLATGSYDFTAKIWDIESQAVLFTFNGHKDNINCVIFSPDGKRLATASADNTVKIWDIKTQKIIHSFSGNKNENLKNPLAGIVQMIHLAASEQNEAIARDTVYCAAFSPDGKYLAVGSSDKTIKIWDLATLTISHTFFEHRGAVYSVTFSPDGKFVASGSADQTAKVWNVETPTAPLTFYGHAGVVWSVSFSPNGEYLATASNDKTIRVWDLETHKAIFTFGGFANAVKNVAFSADSEQLAGGSDDKTIRIWTVAKQHEILTLTGHTGAVTSVAFSPDGTKLITGSYDKTSKIWDLETRQEVYTLAEHTAAVRSVAFSPDGRRMATGSEDGSAIVWDLEDIRNNFTISDDYHKSVTCVDFSPDGKWLGIAFSDDMNIVAEIWEMDSLRQIYSLSQELESDLLSIDFSHDGKHLASGSVYGETIIWDIISGQDWSSKSLEDFYTFSKDDGWVICVAFSPDSKYLATGSSDKTVKIWDIETQTVLFTLFDHNETIRSVAFSPDGKWLATGSDDKTIKIWDQETQTVPFSLSGHTGGVNSVAFSPDGKRLATASDDRTVKIWDLSGEGLIKRWQRKGCSNYLTGSQVDAYDLEFILEARPQNEQSLCQTNEVRQIEVFAALYASKTRYRQQLQRTATNFGRATRLYNYTVTSSSDSTLGLPLGDLYRNWALDILASSHPDTAWKYIHLACLWRLSPKKKSAEYEFFGDYYYEQGKVLEAKILYEYAERFEPSVKTLQQLHDISGELSYSFDIKRLLKSEDAGYLREYGDFFFNRGEWNTAKQFYEKSEGKLHSTYVLKNLFEISEKTKENFDFQRFYSEEAIELREYGGYFFGKEKWNEAKQLYEEAEQIEHGLYGSIRLHEISEKTGESFDFHNFLNTESVEELDKYGDYFFEKEKWQEAKQLYEKAESINRSFMRRLQLKKILDKTGEHVDFQRCLSNSDFWELYEWGDYFFDKEKWHEARQLYEKAEKLEHNPTLLIRLHRIMENTGQPFDFQRFLSSKNPKELNQYATYFTQKADTLNFYSNRIPRYQSALLLREKQLTLDTTAATRLAIANEYVRLAYYQLFLPDGAAAEASIRRCLELDPTNKYAPTNLAPALLLQNRLAEAEAEYRKWKDMEYGENDLPTYREAFLADLDELEKQGVKHPDFEKARTLLKQE